jgi:thioredoxin domain-containing protein 5
VQKLVYWDNDKTGGKIKVTATSIFSAIEGVTDGSIPTKHSENLLERMIRVSV